MKDSWDVRLFQTKTGKLEEVSGENERSSQGQFLRDLVYVYVESHKTTLL